MEADAALIPIEKSPEIYLINRTMKLYRDLFKANLHAALSARYLMLAPEFALFCVRQI